MDDDTIAARAGAALLNSARVLNAWSMILALSGILTLCLRPVTAIAALLFTLSLSAAALQLYHALRCRFDGAVFQTLGGASEHYARFDRWLATLQLRATPAAERSIAERVRGASRLLRRQMLSLVVQALLLGAGVAALVAGPV